MLRRLWLDEDTVEPVELDVGPGRVVAFSRRSPERTQRNEDALGVWQLGPDHAVLAVADGMGGAPGGKAAARAVLESVDHELTTQADAVLAARSARAALIDGIDRASASIRAMGVGAASTVVLAEIHPTDDDPVTVRCIHVGDSQLLHCGQRGALRFRSVPHSPVGYAVEAGILDESAAFVHEDRHLVSNMIGAADMHIQFGQRMAVQRHDTIVLASDGLWDNVAMDRAVDLVRTGPIRAAANRLFDAAVATMDRTDGGPCKPDDLTLLVFRRGA